MKRLSVLLVLIFFAVVMYFYLKAPKLPVPNVESEIIEGELFAAGLKRTYRYYRPGKLPEKSPLVIVLHIAKSGSTDMREMTNRRFDQLADRHKFVVAYPDGYGGNWNDCRKLDNDSAHSLNIDDTGFIKSLIGYFAESHKIDRNRVYVTGMSNGGQMCIRLAVEIPESIRAIAPLVAQLPVPDTSVCGNPRSPIPILLLHGTDDPMSPYRGGVYSMLGIFKRGKVLSVDDTLQYWLKLNNNNGVPAVEIIHAAGNPEGMHIEKKIWKEKNRPEVRQYVVRGGGHTMPGANHLTRIVFGRTYDGYLMADQVIDFFLGQR